MNIAVTTRTLNDHDNIQIEVNDVLAVLQEMPVPGFAEVLAPLNAILSLAAPDPFDEVNRKLDEANSKLDNMFGVITSALDKNDIQQAVIDAKSELQLLMTSTVSSVEKNLPLDSNRIRNYFEHIYKHFNSCVENSRSYINQFEDSHKDISQPLGVLIGQYMYALEKCQEAYTILIEAARCIQTFYSSYSALCEDVQGWGKLDEIITKHVKYCSEANKTFISENEKHYPANIAPIMSNDLVVIQQSNNAGRYLFWDTEDIVQGYSGNYPSNKSSSYYLLGWKKLDKAPSSNSFKFKFVNLSNPDNKNSPKWGLLIQNEGSEPCFLGATALKLNVGHQDHYYVSTKLAGAVDERAKQWDVDINSDGTLSFVLSGISYMEKGKMRENWGHFTIEDKDSNNCFTVS